jgi:hypothetical protein
VTIPPDFDQATIFGFTFKTGQLNIIGSVLDPEVTRLIISAYSQYGKTQSAAVGVLLDILHSKNKRYAFIAPTIKQTNIIRNYVAKIISETPALCTIVDDAGHRGPEHLKREMSKERITFKNGCEVLTLSAHGSEGETDPGAQLMGFGADVIILDEACLILDEIYRKRIKRMLASIDPKKPPPKIIILVNPWHRENFAYRAWRNPRYKKIHIDWRQGVAEGRVSADFITEQREELTEYEFQVLYESNFPDDGEESLIRHSWIERAKQKQLTLGIRRRIWSLDVAEQGADQTILTCGYTDGILYDVESQVQIRERDTMEIAAAVNDIVPKGERINVDSIGVGAGVYSRLRELGHSAVSIRVSEKPSVNPERYVNLKSQRFWMLRTLFENDLIRLPDEPKLCSQLLQIRYEIKNGKIKIIDPTGKSPDRSDSLMLLLQDGGVRKPKVGNAY